MQPTPVNHILDAHAHSPRQFEEILRLECLKLAVGLGYGRTDKSLEVADELLKFVKSASPAPSPILGEKIKSDGEPQTAQDGEPPATQSLNPHERRTATRRGVAMKIADNLQNFLEESHGDQSVEAVCQRSYFHEALNQMNRVIFV